MKRKKLFISLLCLVFLLSGIMTVAVWAESSVTDEQITAALITDKETYSAEESISAHISLKNISDNDLSDITAVISVPEGYAVGRGEQRLTRNAWEEANRSPGKRTASFL